MFSLRKHAYAIYRDFFGYIKMKISPEKKIDILNMFAQNIPCGYTLDAPRQGGSNEYPQCMYWSKSKNEIGISLRIPFLLYKSGVQWSIHYTDMFS